MNKITINTVVKHPYKDEDILIPIIKKNDIADALRELYSMISNTQKKVLIDVLKSTYHLKYGTIIANEEVLEILSKVEIDIKWNDKENLLNITRSPLFNIKSKYITPKNSIFLYADISLGCWADSLSDTDMESIIKEISIDAKD